MRPSTAASSIPTATIRMACLPTISSARDTASTHRSLLRSLGPLSNPRALLCRKRPLPAVTRRPPTTAFGSHRLILPWLPLRTPWIGYSFCPTSTTTFEVPARMRALSNVAAPNRSTDLVQWESMNQTPGMAANPKRPAERRFGCETIRQPGALGRAFMDPADGWLPARVLRHRARWRWVPSVGRLASGRIRQPACGRCARRRHRCTASRLAGRVRLK